MPTEVRCPMPECRKRIDLDALPPFPQQPAEPPCLHFIATWGADRAPMAESVMFALTHNREFTIRSVRPPEIPRDWIDPVRTELEAAARRFAHEVAAIRAEAETAALFGDVHERNHVARMFASLILGNDAPPGGT
jgi:hypothetical protein